MKRSKATMLLLLSRIALVVVLALVVQYVDGNQRIVYVSKPFSEDGDKFPKYGNVNTLLCCVYGNCSCHSFDDALDNLTSNVMLNITTDVMLSLLIKASSLENVSIIGHNNPTVNCKGVGGIHFTFCHNCIIQGITWDRCGTEIIVNDIVPGLKLSYSSNIIIQNCSFQHSIGQAVVLSDISGDVNINHCKFVNNHFRGHGVAISYSSNNIINYSPLLFKLYNCNFTHNKGSVSNCSFTHKGAVSLVHIENGMPGLNNNITLCDSIFYNNQGVSIYVANQKLYLHGKHLFQSNTACFGAGIYISNSSTVIFSRNSDVVFIQNSARYGGGAIYCGGSLLFTDNSITVFSNNNADEGGAIYSFEGNTISFENSSTTEFINNNASNGGAIYIACTAIYGIISLNFKNNSTTVFSNNNAYYGGGAIGSSNGGDTISFEDNSTTVFNNNNAHYGGAIHSSHDGFVSFEDNSNTVFSNNVGYFDGGAIYSVTRSTLSFKGNAKTVFSNNNAGNRGGAIYSYDCNILEENSPYSVFSNNTSANGGTIDSLLNSNDNPSNLKLYDPAICIDDDDDDREQGCGKYYINHVMFGQYISACAVNYCNYPVDAKNDIESYEQGEDNYATIYDSSNLETCGYQGISMTGYPSLSKPLNYSIKIQLFGNGYSSKWKQIYITLTVELSPCYPGFWQYPNSVKCECYHDNNDIVFCSSNSSTIKRGYWFGNVTKKPTVTFCPINYCNFTCCEIFNGYYHLSPARDNQCRSHRSGTACGSCTHGYTLSFDSTDCVSVESCTTGQTVLVILLTVLYWVVIVTLVFAIMYYKVGIGYLYSITYYYSIVDILLNQNLYASRGLYLTVSIMSSFSKITPQFLGELCLTTGMSGIDQQIIHYIHPSAIILILVIISLIARKSRRFSSFISRGIIHVICCLLLLSYTSVASTSMLLMRPLKFHRIDKVYTYLSPDIEYFHGRHLAYSIVALLYTISFVIGLPLLLTLEPFLNYKINFIKIKPLLDQFQGCYKDKYRCFAGYYMICRLVIISIVIANSSNDFVANYAIITICGVIALIHLMLKPYNNEIINKLDGVTLQLIIFIAVLLLFDDFDSPFVITMVFTLFILPLLNFFAVTIFLHKDDLRKIVTRFTAKDESPTCSNSNASNNETPKEPKEFHFIIDDSMRKNAIICDV